MALSAAECLKLIRKNDKQFLQELLLIIRRIAAKWSWTDEAALHDITQDCFVKLVSNLERGQFKERASFKTYLYTIVRNTCVDHYRAARTAQLIDIAKVSLTDPVPSQEDRLISADERRIASKVILALPKECRRLWRAIFFGKRTYKQAADMLGFTEGTVKRKMWECRQMAQKMVKGFEK